MTHCSFKSCRKKIIFLTIDCSACNMKFCPMHRLLEDHNCVKYEEYVDKKFKQNAKILKEQATIKKKVDNI